MSKLAETEPSEADAIRPGGCVGLGATPPSVAYRAAMWAVTMFSNICCAPTVETGPDPSFAWYSVASFQYCMAVGCETPENSGYLATHAA